MNEQNLENNSLAEQGKQNEPIKDRDNKKLLVGVGGWLLFFCVGLVILNPMLRLGGSIYSYYETNQYFDKVNGLKLFVTIEVLLAIIFSLFSIYAGLMLYWKRPNAVNIAKSFLLTVIAITLIGVGVVYIVGLPGEAIDAMREDIFRDTFRAFMYVGVWFTYLNKSIRVKNTFIGV